MNKFYINLFLIFVFVVNIQAIEKVSLQLAWKHQFQSAGYYMAKEKGFYKKYGLEVSIREFNETRDNLDDVLRGKVDFAVGRSSLIYEGLEGKPLVMLAAIFQHSPVILLTKQRDDLQKISDFKNKNIMLMQDKIGLASIDAMLLSSGVKDTMYTRKKQSFTLDDLKNDKVDATLAYSSNEPFDLEQNHIKYKIFSPREYGFDFYSDILYTSESLVEKKLKMVDAFKKASLEGWEYAMHNPNEAIKIILKKYNTQNRTKKALKFEAESMIDLIDYKHVKIGNINKRRVDDIAQVYKLMGYVSKNNSLKNLIFDFDTKSITLTTKEKVWIDTHRVSVGVEQWNPVVFSNTGEDIDGIAGDFMKKIIALTGLKIRVVNEQWSRLINDFKDKKIDILPATYFTQERSTFGLYSSAYFKMKDYIYVKEENNKIQSLGDLNKNFGKLAIIKGYGTLPKIIQKYPNIKIVLTKDLDESIQKLLLGSVDALYEGGIAVEKTISDELITGLKGFPEASFKASPLYLFSKIDEPILQSILQKALNNISAQERNKIVSKWFKKSHTSIPTLNRKKEKDISFVDLMSPEELVVICLLFLLFTFFAYQVYLKSDVLDVKLKTFNKAIIAFELSIILFMIYEIIVLDRTENRLAKAHAEQFSMIQVADELRQSSDDLTHFARTYAETEDISYKEKYLKILDIRDGKVSRPIGYNAIYWDLDPMTREERHPNGEKISFKEMIDKLPFSQAEIAKLQESENNSNDLVNLETKAFAAIMNNNAKYAAKLLHSQAYYVAKQQIMSPIDEMITILYERTDTEIINLDRKISNQFQYILFIGLLFILGNIFIYILLVKKVNRPIEYLTGIIRQFQSGDKNIQEKTFYNDEIGEMNREFFSMKEKLTLQTKDLKKQLSVVKIAEKKQQELIQEIDRQKEFVQTLLDSQEQLIITTDGKTLLSANETFLDFFTVDSPEEFMKVYDATCICNTFNTNAPQGYLQISMGRETWIDYIISHPYDTTHKVMISKNNLDFIFSVTAAQLPGNRTVKSAVFTNITEMENARIEIDEINKHTKESIEYAALIQSSLIPNNNLMRKYFKDQFVIWHPKDTVGGDIYLFDELRNEDECLLMVIDCTGHGVPGAFVTMLVKAIERQITSKINHSDETVSPAKILSVFNKNMKQLLKQEDISSVSNAGFDGQVVYYNKKDKILKTASARNEIFYYQNDELKVIKGDRHSIGYKDSDINFEFTEHTIDVSQETTIYISSDGYWDQNGGEKDLPFGKKRLKKMLERIHNESMADQQEEFLYTLEAYKADNDTNDDITVVGLKI